MDKGKGIELHRMTPESTRDFSLPLSCFALFLICPNSLHCMLQYIILCSMNKLVYKSFNKHGFLQSPSFLMESLVTSCLHLHRASSEHIPLNRSRGCFTFRPCSNFIKHCLSWLESYVILHNLLFKRLTYFQKVNIWFILHDS